MELPASARSVTRPLSQGGAKRSSAAATAAVPATSAAGRGSGRSSPDASAIPSTRNTGIPMAGNVQIQSPDACTAKYASVPSAAAPATVSRRRETPTMTRTKKPTSSAKPTMPVSSRTSSGSEWARTGVSMLRPSCR